MLPCTHYLPDLKLQFPFSHENLPCSHGNHSTVFQWSTPSLVHINGLVLHDQSGPVSHPWAQPPSVSQPASSVAMLAATTTKPAEYCGWLAPVGDDHPPFSGWVKGVWGSQLSTWLPPSPRKQFRTQSLSAGAPLH